MTDGKKLCILTVHGIGFQQPPIDSAAGYADVLHENLSAGLQALGSSLGKDPQRNPGPFGPVYVRSAKPGTRDHEWGLKRLGTIHYRAGQTAENHGCVTSLPQGTVSSRAWRNAPKLPGRCSLCGKPIPDTM
jgi:hypothetical protein